VRYLLRRFKCIYCSLMSIVDAMIEMG